MSCPLNKQKFVGSGYRKPCTASSELDTKMKQMLLERETQDRILYPQANEQVSLDSTKPKPQPNTQNGTA